MSQPAPPQRGNPRMSDVIRSVAVIVAIVLVSWFGGQWVLGRTPDRPTSQVDWRMAASGVEPSEGFVPLVPPSIPDGWYVNAARFDDGHWHLGLTDGKHYIGLEQGKSSVAALVKHYAKDTKEQGLVDLGGDHWTRRSGGGSTVFTRELSPGLAALVTGTAKPSEIESFTATLAPYSG